MTRLVLFHDERALRWRPFVDTRPIGEILYGAHTLRARAEHALGVQASGYAGAPHLEGFDEPGAPPSCTPSTNAADATIYLSARAAIDPPTAPLPRGATTLELGGEVVGWVVPPGGDPPTAQALASPTTAASSGTRVALPGELLGWPWDLMAANPARISADVAPAQGVTRVHQGVHVIGNHAIVLDEDAAIEPGVTVDVRAGPVWLAPGARVEGPARITGPLFLGAGSTILGGPVGSSSIGPVCKVRGEVTDSILLGYVNKAHDGHLGHAVLGRWVNLGAGTINSDLKNNYSAVRIGLPGEDVDTGLLKVGCFLGDHVRTGIATPINTGTVIGAGSNVFGGRMPPSYVPPFSWGSGDELDEYDLERFLDTVAAVMKRRELDLTPGTRAVLTRAFGSSRGERTTQKLSR